MIYDRRSDSSTGHAKTAYVSPSAIFVDVPTSLEDWIHIIIGVRAYIHVHGAILISAGRRV